jgi:hypothetical protein
MSRMQPPEDFSASDKMDQEDQPSTLSLMGGIVRSQDLSDGQGADQDAGRGARRVWSQGPVLIAALAIFAAGALYTMRLTQGDLKNDASTDAVAAKIENALTKLTRPGAISDDDPLKRANLESLFQDTETIVAMFAANRTDHQVPIEYVKKNPFALTLNLTAPGDLVDPQAGNNVRRMKELQKELAGLKLVSVMAGRIPIAVINNDFYKTGQKIGSFQIETIEGLNVHLRSGEDRFTLSLESSPSPSRRR